MTLEPILFVPDCHRPYHSQQGWELLLQVGMWLKPKHLVVLGDFCDFYAISKYDKDPIRATKLPEELASVQVGLDELDGLGAKHKVFLAGNHCLSLEHRVLTPDGWASYAHVAVGTQIATMNAAGNLEWQRVLSVIKRKVRPQETLYDYETPFASLRITDQHRVVRLTTTQHHCIVSTAAECPDNFDVITGLPSNHAPLPLNDDQLRLAALASTDVHYDRDGRHVIIYQSEGKHRYVEAVLRKGGVTFRRLKRIRNITQICGRTLLKPALPSYEYHLDAGSSLWVRSLTGLERKGRLPIWVRALSDAQWDIFLEELIHADGTIPKNHVTSCIFYGELPICEDVQCAAVTHGWRASIVEYRPNQFRVNLTKYTRVRIEHWQASNTKPQPGEEVWCLSVPNRNFITERRGRVHVTGNCDRLRRYLQVKAPELFGLVSIPQLFQLKERGWTYVPYRNDYRIGKLYLTHDVGNTGRYSTYQALDSYQHSVVTAHLHRLSYVVEGNAVGEYKVGAQFGWLGEVNDLDYMHRIKARRNWTLGFGVGYLNPKSGVVYVQPVPIVKGTCVVGGKGFEA